MVEEIKNLIKEDEDDDGGLQWRIAMEANAGKQRKREDGFGRGKG